MRALVLSVFIVLSLVAVAALSPVFAASYSPYGEVCTGRGSTGSVCSASSGNPVVGPDGVLTKAIQIIAIITGVAAVIMIIIGGFRYVLANGDSNNINSAKNTILYAIIGIVIAASAQAIVSFVLRRIT